MTSFESNGHKRSATASTSARQVMFGLLTGIVVMALGLVLAQIDQPGWHLASVGLFLICLSVAHPIRQVCRIPGLLLPVKINPLQGAAKR